MPSIVEVIREFLLIERVFTAEDFKHSDKLQVEDLAIILHYPKIITGTSLVYMTRELLLYVF